MKSNSILSLALLSALTAGAFAQGSLTPPAGAPAPVFKTLDQVEARTPISTVPFAISQPGSYYLTGNLDVPSGNAITITASGVTLDMNGFTISSTTDTSTTGTGILLTGPLKDVTISNGHIRGGTTFDTGTGAFSGTGFSYGFATSGAQANNVLVSRVTVSGCRSNGIVLGSSGTTVEFCSVRTVGNIGINANLVNNCLSLECGSAGISGQEVTNSRAGSSGGSDGIFANVVNNCGGVSVSGTGINCTSATNSTGVSTSGNGLVAQLAQNSFGRTASGSRGMHVSGTASFCRGRNDAVGGVALEAAIAVGCTAQAGTITSPQKHLGTP